MERIGFIGLGVMGLPMSKRLRDAGYELYVYDIDPRPIKILKDLGAHEGTSPKDVSARSEIIISVLPTPAITKEVALGVDGIVRGVQPGSVYVDMSTSNPMVTREIHEDFKGKKVEMLDAPVSGGVKGAKEGTLTIMVGGVEVVFEKLRPILLTMGKRVIHVGKLGSGHTIKVINNMLFAVTMAATSEALALGKKAGVDPVVMRDVMNTSSGASYALDYKVRDFVLPRNFEPGFTVDFQIKDMDLALGLAKDLGAPVVLGSLVRQMYQALAVKGYGKKDTSIIISVFEETMGSGEIRT